MLERICVLVLGIIFAVLGLVLVIDGDKFGWFLLLLGLFFITLVFADWMSKAPERKAALAEKEKMAQMDCIWGNQLPHTTGLPVAEKVVCSVYYLPDKLVIESGAANFSLPTDRITDISVITDVEIQKHYTSSIGGAVGGALLFGPLGAMIGGRSKTQTSKTLTYFLVFTYLKDDEIKYVTFDATKKLIEARQLEKLFKEQGRTSIEVNL